MYKMQLLQATAGPVVQVLGQEGWGGMNPNSPSFVILQPLW